MWHLASMQVSATCMCRFIVNSGGHQLDFVAFGLVIVVFFLIAWGTPQTSFLNSREPNS